MTEMRTWYVNRLRDRSDALGGDLLVNDLGRFVGIAPEALSVADKMIAP